MRKIQNSMYSDFPQNRKNKKIKKSKIFLIVVLFICIIIASFVAYSTFKNGWGLRGMLATAVGHNAQTKDNLEEFKVLLLGVSQDISSNLSDTIIVASYNPKMQRGTLLSIPRDTYIGNNEKTADSYDKINAVYKKGPDEILDKVNNITGLDIKYYVVIETEALAKLVDTIGGVEFDVPIEMDYDDPTQDLHIHLDKGSQILNGKQAEQVVRFRHNNNGTTYSSEYGDNDIGRMKTQRAFLTQVLKQTINIKNIFKINELLDIAYENVQTNIDLESVKDYIPYVIEFDINNLQTGVLPGESKRINNLWFFRYNKSKTKELIEKMYYYKDIESSIQNDFNVTKENTTLNTLGVRGKEDVKIEVLNGSGKSSNLTKVVNILKDEGYNVYKTGTTATTSTTEIKNRTNCSLSISSDIRDTLGVGSIKSSYNASSTIDYTIIIGKDYK